jgi:hypothetical protein
MEKSRTDPELFEAECEATIAAEEALNASVLRTLLLPSTEGRLVSCGQVEAVQKAVTEAMPADHQVDEIEKRLIEAAEKVRRTSGTQAFVLPIGDGYIIACGEPRDVAQILGSEGESREKPIDRHLHGCP